MKRANLKKLAFEWFEKGNHDFDEAKRSFKNSGWPDVICFLCHQAAEKYLKGFLVSKGVDITRWKIHILVRLLKEAEKYDQGLKELREECESLDPHYIEARYPVETPKVYSRKEAKETLSSAEKIIGLINKKIK